jgi:predicted NAD-dependent protein-ADP-ribosyltransferase YbiA (DUF1768 family)
MQKQLKLTFLNFSTDKIWGIGLGAQNPKAWSKSTWKGQNLLGEALMVVREQLFLKTAAAL